MRINHNISAMVTQNSLRTQGGLMQKSLEKLSTGLRINRASDDAAGLSVSEQMRTQIRGLNMAKQNAEDGIALLQIAEGASNEVTAILQRMRELSVQSANDTLTSVERGYNNTEFSQLMNEIQRISSATQYNGMTLLDGQSGSFGSTGGPSVIHIGANNNGGNAAGTVDKISVAMTSISLGALGLSQGTAATAGSGVSTQAQAFSAISLIDTAIRSVNTMRANMGANINRLESAIANIANQAYNTQDAEARIRDVDFATETTFFTKTQILTQASTAMLAQANAIPQTVLSLLR